MIKTAPVLKSSAPVIGNNVQINYPHQTIPVQKQLTGSSHLQWNNIPGPRIPAWELLYKDSLNSCHKLFNTIAKSAKDLRGNHK